MKDHIFELQRNVALELVSCNIPFPTFAAAELHQARVVWIIQNWRLNSLVALGGIMFQVKKLVICIFSDPQ